MSGLGDGVIGRPAPGAVGAVSLVGRLGGTLIWGLKGLVEPDESDGLMGSAIGLQAEGSKSLVFGSFLIQNLTAET